ncbi:hypothetical protein [Futiania mangrovi]|uniref:Glycerophosphoryl diester phosphodiesterase membrane domain-containing protein n=1 Tax=Futiania mangrovi TaxID=2959716 RepID=A0A9J6PC61_9PROT|nr:hypothetical protein [Futiania mangrovii]MCP1336129.1 hypothetical protein [Futiania mangrovii]
MAGSFSIGGIIWQSVLTLRRNLTVFLGVSATFVVMSILSRMFVDAVLGSEESAIASNVVGALVNLTISYLATAVLVSATLIDLSGQKPTFNSVLGIAPLAMASALAPAVLMALGVLAGLSVFVLPGLFLATLWYVAIPSAVVERLPGIGALRRSVLLTEGFRWQVFALLIAVSVLVLSVVLASSVIVGASAEAGARIFPIVILGLSQGLVGAFGSITATICYHDLRALKEGVPTARMLGQMGGRGT